MAERTDLEVSGSSHPSPDAWVLYFPWVKNPLPMNGGRGSWGGHHRKVRTVKDQVRYSIRAARIPALGSHACRQHETHVGPHRCICGESWPRIEVTN